MTGDMAALHLLSTLIKDVQNFRSLVFIKLHNVRLVT